MPEFTIRTTQGKGRLTVNPTAVSLVVNEGKRREVREILPRSAFVAAAFRRGGLFQPPSVQITGHGIGWNFTHKQAQDIYDAVQEAMR